jgi:NAD(P)H-nitrite reductase large subunit
VCACFAVGRATILEAIEAAKLTSAAEIGTALRAGTNCGSCLPELAAILREGDGERSPPGEIGALHYDVNRVKQGVADLPARVEELESQRPD